jgi:hypothetical protein
VARGDFRQQAVVAFREVILDPPELFVHDVEVVEEPLLGRCDLALRPGCLDDVPVGGHQRLAVLTDPGEEIAPFARLVGGALSGGQTLGVLLQPFDAEDLGADRFFHLERHCDDVGGGLHFLRTSDGRRSTAGGGHSTVLLMDISTTVRYFCFSSRAAQRA